MKKIISLILVVMMAFSCVSLCFNVSAAANDRVNYPVVYLRGDGTGIYDQNGKLVALREGDGKISPEEVSELIYPYLTKAVLKGEWDEYYEAFARLFSDVYEGSALDKNGNSPEGVGIANRVIEVNKKDMVTDYKNESGRYKLTDYTFWYDWRLNPLEVADELNEYIKGVKSATGAEKVGLVGKCLGGSYVLAYLSKYGYDDICKLMFDSTVGNGAEKMSDLMSGKIQINEKAIQRSEIEKQHTDTNMEEADLFLSELIRTSADMLDENDVLHLTEKTFAAFYKRIYKGLLPKVLLATTGTWLGYWSTVLPADFETALNLVYGEKGSDTRKEYAGLVQKLEDYNTQVRQRIPEIVKGAKNAGVDVGIVAKYGVQFIPFLASANKQSDSFISIERSTFGATAADIAKTLPDSYIAQRVAEGKGKYINPDKSVDMSTCLFPDSTWLCAGLTHNNYPDYLSMGLISDFMNYDGCMTIDSYSKYPQFMVYTKDGSVVPMTTDNCDDFTEWDNKEIEKHSLKTKFTSFFAFYRNIFKLFISTIRSKIFHR